MKCWSWKESFSQSHLSDNDQHLGHRLWQKAGICNQHKHIQGSAKDDDETAMAARRYNLTISPDKNVAHADSIRFVGLRAVAPLVMP
jgi:hypothetical protein